MTFILVNEMAVTTAAQEFLDWFNNRSGGRSTGWLQYDTAPAGPLRVDCSDSAALLDPFSLLTFRSATVFPSLAEAYDTDVIDGEFGKEVPADAISPDEEFNLSIAREDERNDLVTIIFGITDSGWRVAKVGRTFYEGAFPDEKALTRSLLDVFHELKAIRDRPTAERFHP